MYGVLCVCVYRNRYILHDKGQFSGVFTLDKVSVAELKVSIDRLATRKWHLENGRVLLGYEMNARLSITYSSSISTPFNVLLLC